MQAMTPRILNAKCHVLTVVVMLAGLGIASSALGATTRSDCTGLATATKGKSENPMDVLSVSPVDHVPSETVTGNLERVDSQIADSDNAAPFLYLTPRVASVLRDIFEAARDLTEGTTENPVSSPVADTDKQRENQELIEEPLPLQEADVDVDLPFIQRQMFRTDI